MSDISSSSLTSFSSDFSEIFTPGQSSIIENTGMLSGTTVSHKTGNEEGESRVDFDNLFKRFEALKTPLTERKGEQSCDLTFKGLQEILNEPITPLTEEELGCTPPTKEELRVIKGSISNEIMSAKSNHAQVLHEGDEVPIVEKERKPVIKPLHEMQQDLEELKESLHNKIWANPLTNNEITFFDNIESAQDANTICSLIGELRQGCFKNTYASPFSKKITPEQIGDISTKAKEVVFTIQQEIAAKINSSSAILRELKKETNLTSAAWEQIKLATGDNKLAREDFDKAKELLKGEKIGKNNDFIHFIEAASIMAGHAQIAAQRIKEELEDVKTDGFVFVDNKNKLNAQAGRAGASPQSVANPLDVPTETPPQSLGKQEQLAEELKKGLLGLLDKEAVQNTKEATGLDVEERKELQSVFQEYRDAMKKCYELTSKAGRLAQEKESTVSDDDISAISALFSNIVNSAIDPDVQYKGLNVKALTCTIKDRSGLDKIEEKCKKLIEVKEQDPNHELLPSNLLANQIEKRVLDEKKALEIESVPKEEEPSLEGETEDWEIINNCDDIDNS
ncbi:MAG: hypothetical protein ACH346_02870 [Chthoniobacterales bacterium]